MPPLVSIALSVRNAARTLRPALRSVMLQDFEDWELLVIDDGSTDETAAIVQEFRDRRIHFQADGRQLGLGARLNEAVARARGAFVARMDGDDLAYPHRISRQLRYMQDHPDIHLVGAGAAVFSDDGAPRGARRPAERHDEICARPHFGFAMIHPTYFGRADWFRRHAYDPAMTRAQDQELLLRTYRTSRFANVPELLLGYREEKVSLRKATLGRMLYLRRLMAADRATRGAARTTAAALMMSKIALDAVGSLPGGSPLLKHRTPPISPDEARAFRQVWRACEGEG